MSGPKEAVKFKSLIPSAPGQELIMVIDTTSLEA